MIEDESFVARLAVLHPGEILGREFLEPLEMSQNWLTVATGVSPRRTNEILLGKRRFEADTAPRLSRYFATTDGFSPNLHVRFNLGT